MSSFGYVFCIRVIASSLSAFVFLELSMLSGII